MQIKEQNLYQAIENCLLLSDSKSRIVTVPTIKNLQLVFAKATQKRTVTVMAYYTRNFKIGNVKRSAWVRIGDISSDKLEHLKDAEWKISSKNPVSLDDVKNIISKLNQLSSSEMQKLVSIRKHGDIAEDLLDRVKTTSTLSVQVAGASKIQKITPTKEITLKSLKDELELVDLKIRRIELMQKIRSLENN